MSVLYVADDFGLLPTIDRAIVALADARALDATSVLINERPHALPELARNRDLHIGLHLELTSGRPYCDPASIPDLVGADGRFHPLPQLIVRSLRGAIRRSSLVREISAQLAALEAAIGRAADHIDGHQHVHCLPAVFAALEAVLARREHAQPRLRLGRIADAARNPRLLPVDALIGWQRFRRAIGLTQWDFLAPDVTFDYAASALRTADPDQLTEVMLHVAHPGEPDASLDATSYPYAARVAQFERRMTEAGRT